MNKESQFFIMAWGNKSTGLTPMFNNRSASYPNKNNDNIIRQIIINLPIALYTIAIFLHALGIIILLPYRRKRNQDHIIINMSISEIGISLLDIAQNILLRDKTLKKYLAGVIMTNCSIFVIPCFFILTILTMDRFFEVRLNIKYSIYCTRKRMVFALVICWITGFVTGLIFLYIKIRHKVHVLMIIYKFVYPIYESILLIIAIIVYGYIYKKFLNHKRKPFSLGKIGSTIKSQRSCITEKPVPTRKKPIKTERSFIYTRTRLVLKRKNFFPPFLIMFTFALFVILPDLLNLFLVYIVGRKDLIFWSNILLCLYATGFICDAVIYIYLHRHLRAVLMRTFVKKFKATNTLSSDYSCSEANNNHNGRVATVFQKQQMYENLRKYENSNF